MALLRYVNHSYVRPLRFHSWGFEVYRYFGTFSRSMLSMFAPGPTPESVPSLCSAKSIKESQSQDVSSALTMFFLPLSLSLSLYLSLYAIYIYIIIYVYVCVCLWLSICLYIFFTLLYIIIYYCIYIYIYIYRYKSVQTSLSHSFSAPRNWPWETGCPSRGSSRRLGTCDSSRGFQWEILGKTMGKYSKTHLVGGFTPWFSVG